MSHLEVSYSGEYEVLKNDGVTYYVANTTRPDEPDYHVAQKIEVESPSTILGDWSYSVINNGVKIVRYEGLDSEVTIPTHINNLPVKIIGKSSFNTYALLKKLTIPDGITKIEDFAFGNCFSLIQINLPNSITSIGKGTFGNCKSIESITLPNTITSIPDMTFGACENLKNVSIPVSVTSIGDLAFSTCTSLVSVHIPNKAVNIHPNAFDQTTKINIG
jgi:hypothetical protein